MKATAVIGALKGLVYIVTLPIYAAIVFLILAGRRLALALRANGHGYNRAM